ncbi:hypothetical protein [Clostridioides sp. ZZV15-6598]|uniref:hypothetical protein n=1 Tax=Clostridioides sp. ZZV15-6598 TaxID=2811501 RepID=UPI001D11BD80|nr:hypothetical protein [Clostridioides sp. ZZV15-6598]
MLIEVIEKNNEKLQLGDIIAVNGNNELYMVIALRETLGEHVLVNIRNGYESLGSCKSLRHLEGDLKRRGYKLYSSDDYKLRLVPRE